MISTTGSSSISDTNLGEQRQQTEAFPWALLAWLAVFMVACYLPMMRLLLAQWQSQEDMSHGLFAPLIAGYFVWQRRSALLAAPAAPNRWGLLILIYGAVQAVIGSLGAELFLSQSAILITLCGLLLYLRGIPTLKILAFPLFLLCFMIPIPTLVYKEITFPAQIMASRVAERVLDFLGYTVIRDGNILELSGQQMSVAEACNGIRSFLSLSFLSVVYASLVDDKVWMRWLLLAVALPVAIVANALRIVLTGVVGAYDTELAYGVFHGISGWVITLMAFLILMGIHKIFDMVYQVIHGKTRPAL